MLLKDKKTIVTGAAQGIGQAIAQVFVKNGASVLITDKSQHLEEVAKTLKGYGEIKSVIGDICDDNHLMNLIKTCRKDWGGLDVLVNNAGMTIKSKLGMTTKKDTQNLFETNIYHHFKSICHQGYVKIEVSGNNKHSIYRRNPRDGRFSLLFC